MEKKNLEGKSPLAKDPNISTIETESPPLLNEGPNSEEKNCRGVLSMAASAALARRTCAAYLPLAVNGSFTGIETDQITSAKKSSAIDEKNRRDILTLAATAA